jgi:hypothetical protein
VEWATNEDRPVIVTGPGLIDVTVWRQTQSLTVHLVNLTNPMMMKGPVREILPIGEQRVRVLIPKGETVSRVQLLVAGGTPSTSISPGYVEVIVPTIEAHEVVAIDLR